MWTRGQVILMNRCQKTSETWKGFLEGRVTERGKGCWAWDMEGPQRSKRHREERAVDGDPEPPIKDNLDKWR